MSTHPRTTSRSALAIVLAATMAAGLPAVLSGCEQKSGQRESGTVQLAEAEVKDFEITTLATGELEARERVELRSNVERQTAIVEIVPEGSRVQAGDVLVRLNSDEIKREIEEEELQLSEARLNLEAAETAYDIQVSDNAASLRKAQLAVDLAELALQQWENGENVKQLKQLETAIEKTKRDLERLKEKKEKSDELYEKNFISYDEWKRDEIALLEAEAAYEQAELNLDVYETYQVKRDREQKLSDLEEAKQELVRVQKTNEINLKNRDSTRQNRAVQLGRREERMAEWTKQFEACTITAPTAGLVVYGSTVQSDDWRSQNEGPIAVGRQIRNNDLIIALPDTSEMIASVKVHESLAGRVRPGQRANIKVDALGELTIPGEVESVGLLAETGGWRDPNRREYTVRVRVKPGPHSNDLKPSMRCQAELVLGTVEQALTVPVQAVFSDGAVRYVLVPDGGRYTRRPVSLGQRSDLYAQITAGIEPGTEVLLRDPRPGEVVDEPWSAEQLAAAGYTLDEDGNPVSPRRGRPGMRPGGMPAGGPPAGGRPSGMTKGEGAGDSTAKAEPASEGGEKAVPSAGTETAEAAKPTDSETPGEPAKAAEPAESTKTE